MAIGERHTAVVHKLTADEAMGRPSAEVPGARLDMSAHPTDFKWDASEHPRDAHGRFGSGGVRVSGITGAADEFIGASKNPRRDHDVRQDFANGETMHAIAQKYTLGIPRIREILRDAPLPPPTKPLPPGVVIPTFKPRPPRKRGGTATPTPTPSVPPTKRQEDTRTAAEVRKAFIETLGKTASADPTFGAHVAAADRQLRDAANEHRQAAEAAEHAAKLGENMKPHLDRLASALTKLSDSVYRKADVISRGMIADVSSEDARRAMTAAINPSGHVGSFRAIVRGSNYELKDTAGMVVDYFKKLGIDAPSASHIGSGGAGEIAASVIKSKKSRSHYDMYSTTAKIGASRSGAAVAHELGHFVEHKGGFYNAAKNWRDGRAPGETARRIPGYGNNEVGVRDKFSDPYVGKVYEVGVTEVISMGIEYMWSNPAKFAKNDPDHFDFIVDVLRGKNRG